MQFLGVFKCKCDIKRIINSISIRKILSGQGNNALNSSCDSRSFKPDKDATLQLSGYLG